MEKLQTELKVIWNELYQSKNENILNNFINELSDFKKNLKTNKKPNTEWFKNTVVYSLYVDLFNKDFDGLTNKLPYLNDLGINCIWLLPILDSPMKDAGFDISDYQKIRPDLLGNKGDKSFENFLEKAHNLNIRVIFDIAINHSSTEHEWFKQSALKEQNKYSDYYIWSDDGKQYADCRLLFKGMVNSNWEKHENGKYYFHRFFEFQPDLNYRNPEVLLDMCRNIMFWIEKGVDGFRADAIPYLWKEEGTDCENLDNTHQIIKFFRKVTEFLNPEVILLAEACQPPKEVVKYMGDGDECHAGYHFPLMPQIFKAMAMGISNPIKNVLSTNITPAIPDSAQWFTFLRCHDELSLELVYVNEEDRKFIHENYCHKPEWDFRLGEGIGARLSELFKFDIDKITQAFSIILTLPGTPIIYYGDEFAKPNDKEFYKNQIIKTGHNDTRNYVRGKINWNELELKLKDSKTIEHKTFSTLKKMITLRNSNKTISNGDFRFIEIDNSVLAYEKIKNGKKYIFIHNLSQKDIILAAGIKNWNQIIFGSLIKQSNRLVLEAGKTVWLK